MVNSFSFPIQNSFLYYNSFFVILSILFAYFNNSFGNFKYIQKFFCFMVVKTHCTKIITPSFSLSENFHVFRRFYKKKPWNKIVPRLFLLFIIAFIASCRQHMATAACFVRRKGSGLSGPTTHIYKHIYPFSAFGALHFGQSGGVLAFMTSIE